MFHLNVVAGSLVLDLNLNVCNIVQVIMFW